MPDRRLDPTFVRAQIDRLRITHPDIMADEELRQIAIESETDLPEFMNGIVKRMLDAELMAEDQATLMKELKSRRDRYLARHEAMRALAFNIMQEEGVKKLEPIQRTLSVRMGTPKVIITDEALVPPMFTHVIRQPNKTLIKEAIKDGHPVPGAALSNSEPDQYGHKMRTIFSANRRTLKKPQFVTVSTKNDVPSYSLYHSRKYRAEYAKERDNAVYVINIYPRNWPRLR